MTESYCPTWILKTDGEVNSSTRVLQSVNGWETSDIGDTTLMALEFTIGWQRVAGRICSLLALLVVMALLAVLV